MTYDMQYNINSQITTINDVEAFFQHLVSERSLSFHPDDRFEDYISCDDGSNIFSEKECAIYKRLMDECFEYAKRMVLTFMLLALHLCGKPWRNKRMYHLQIKM